MQVPKKHLPVVGLIGIVLIGAAAGSIVYYQYVAPPSLKCGVPPVHRLIFMTAIIKERGGFNIFNAAFLNQADLPSFTTAEGANLTGVSYADYKTSDNTTIYGNVGDTITLYIKSISTNESVVQLPSATGHGFTIETTLTPVQGALTENNIAFGTWYTVTFQIPKQGQAVYRCTQSCSPQHASMAGTFSAGCVG